MSVRQFAIFRIILGTYLSIHFAHLVPYAGELFSNKGVLADPRLNFTFGILPNPLEHLGSALFAQGFVLALCLVALAFAAGYWRHAAAALLWFGWACLFNRNNLISNPSLPYVGLLLVLTMLVPRGESLAPARSSVGWHVPAGVSWTAWTLLAAGYSYSGWVKLQSPSWIDGSAFLHVLNNPLARPGFLRDSLLGLPVLLKLATWSALATELLFLLLCFGRRSRMLAWLTLAAMHASLIFLLDFADLSIGMLMIHLFTFDPAWVELSARINAGHWRQRVLTWKSASTFPRPCDFSLQRWTGHSLLARAGRRRRPLHGAPMNR